MQRANQRETRPVTLVLGCGDVGSAIALHLHRAGFAVVLMDDVDPPWAHRGMAFTNAWYVGNAELEGETAVFCASLRSVPLVLDRSAAIAATTWSWPGVAAALPPIALIDARMRREGPSLSLLAKAPQGLYTIGVGPGFVVGEHVHAALEAATGVQMDDIADHRDTFSICTELPLLGGAGRERFVYSAVGGRFSTARRIGDHVERGEWVGAVGNRPVAAPLTGVLRGLSARGARVEPSTKIIEVDPRNDPALCFGVEERPRRVAEGVLAVLSRAHALPPPRRQ